MNPDLAKLIELQQVDAEIARLKAEIASLPKKVQAIEAQLAEAKDRLEKAKAAIKADETAKRRYESDIQSQNEKISKYREQSLAVKTNDQYKALMQEISFAEQGIRGFEDKILETMIDADAKQEIVRQAEADLKAETAEIEKEKAEEHARTAEDEKALAVQNAKRTELRTGINEDTLRHYDRVLKGRGTGLAEARDQRCTGCQVLLRPQVFNEVLSGAVQSCDSCSRILYYDPSHDQPADDKAKAANKNSGSVERHWVYLDRGENGIFAVLVNAKGSASLRTYDALTGKAASEVQRAKGKVYKEAFKEEFEHGRPLFIDDIANLEEECKEQLPPDVLTELQRQVPARNSNADVTQ